MTRSRDFAGAPFTTSSAGALLQQEEAPDQWMQNAEEAAAAAALRAKADQAPADPGDRETDGGSKTAPAWTAPCGNKKACEQ